MGVVVVITRMWMIILFCQFEYCNSRQFTDSFNLYRLSPSPAPPPSTSIMPNMGALGLKISLLFFKNKDSCYKDKITTINFITTKGWLEEEAASYPCFLPFVQGVTTFFCVDVFYRVCRDDCRDFGCSNCCKIFYCGLDYLIFSPKICSVVALFNLK